MDNLLDFIKRQQQLIDSFLPPKEIMALYQNPIQNAIRPILDIQEKYSHLFNNVGLASIQIADKFTNILDGIENNPEVQFASASELEILTLSQDNLSKKEQYELLKYKETIIENNLVEIISEQQILEAWKGSGHALRSHKSKNPDKARHMLVSLRAMIEHFIEDRLAPNEELKTLPEFKRYFKGRPNVPRHLRIKHFANKFELGMMEEFKPEDISFIIKCYQKLCDLHNADINISQYDLRVIRYKAGLIIWLLAYLDDILTKDRSE